MAVVVNETSGERTESENVAASLVVVISSITGICGNGLVMLSYFMCSKLRSQPGSMFVTNLSLADFLSGVYIQWPAMVNLANPNIKFHGMLCSLHAALTWSIMTVSNWTLAAISIDRAIAINKPFKHRNIVTNFRVKWALLLIWTSSLVISCLSVTGNTIVTYKSSELMCSPKWWKHNTTASYNAAILCFLTPFTVLLLCNVSIIYAVRRLKAVVSHSCPGETEQSNLAFCAKDNTKTLRSLYVLVIVYCFLSAPYFIAKFLTNGDSDEFPQSLFVLFILLMFTASAINPFIYALLRKDHRDAFLTTIEVIKKKVKNMPSSFSREAIASKFRNISSSFSREAIASKFRNIPSSFSREAITSKFRNIPSSFSREVIASKFRNIPSIFSGARKK